MDLRLHLRERFLAHVMVKGSDRYERLVRSRKELLFARAVGSVLEIGAGTGPNLQFLKQAESYLAAEPNVFMHPHLRAEMDRVGVHGRIDGRPAEAVLAGLPENSIDTAVSSLVLCSVKSPQALLAEIRRVLRPGGSLLFLEHVAADDNRLLTCGQYALSPLFWCLGDGCSPTRRTGRLVEAAGFASHDIERFHLPLGPISPHVCGWATK